MKRAAVCIALLSAGIAGCAALRPERENGADGDLERGLDALAAQDYATARTVLDRVYRLHWQERLGQSALLALTAAEIDPRNNERRLSVASDLAARYLNVPGTPQWTVPVAESLYLLAVELGAQEDSLQQAQADRRQAEAEARRLRALPQSQRETVPARIRRLENERNEVQRRLRDTEQRLATREKELRDAQQELERIRKTIKK